MQHQLLEKIALETTETENHTTSARIAVETASAGHRDTFAQSEEVERCAVRLRLTASQPRQVASVWYAEPLPVLQGFETRFTFQLTDQSKRCLEVKDQHFGVRHYRSCSVHGGDGFAFVIHSHPNKTSTLGFNNGKQRSQMGFEGLENSLAIEFDTWFNTEQPDTFYDHVAIYSNGPQVNSLLESARISATVLQDLADGKVHAVKIRYYNELRVSQLGTMRVMQSYLSAHCLYGFLVRVCTVLLVDDESRAVHQGRVRGPPRGHARRVHGRRHRERHADPRDPHQPRGHPAAAGRRGFRGELMYPFGHLLLDRLIDWFTYVDG